MSNIEKEQQVVKKYFLGDLPQQRREQFEERLFSDSQFREIVFIIEDELVDEYVSGRLPLSEQEKFRRCYLLAPHQVEKVRMATLLTEKAELEELPSAAITAKHTPDWRRSFGFQLYRWRWAIVGIALVLTIFVGSAVFRALREDARADLEKEILALNQGTTPVPTDMVVALSPALTRGRQESQSISLAPGDQVLQLVLAPLSGKHQHYGVRLQVVDGPELFVVPNIRGPEAGKPVILRIPSRILTRQDYQLTLFGSENTSSPEAIDNYFFRVIPKQ